MKKIKELGEIEYQLPQMCAKKGHVVDLLDKMICKIDELVRRVNKLEGEQGLF